MTNRVVSISRDPFARHNIIRRKASGKCMWCGSPAKFEYGYSPDAVAVKHTWMKGVFCGISCARIYHNDAF